MSGRDDDAGLREWLARVRAEYWARLAVTAQDEGAGGEPHVVFALGDRHFAVDATFCKGVVRRPRVTRLPGVPPHVLGVVGLRGEVVSATDPARLLALPGERAEGTGYFLVLGAQGVKTALWVDRVSDVALLDGGAALPVDAPWPGIPAGVVSGQWPGQDPPLLRLDPQRYLDVSSVGHAGPDL